MRTSLLVVGLLLAGASAVQAQTIWDPIEIATGSYSDGRDACPYVGSWLYFPELGLVSDGVGVVYRIVMPGSGPLLPWTIQALPQGWDAMLAVCQRTDLTQCVDFSDFAANGAGEGVTIPAVAGTYYVVVGTGFAAIPGNCGNYVLTAAHP
ncbi:hypothetical protein [Dokdonella ginsengisoli]|uniref:Peptidase C-terminal archaeal/bacterial domain-containing protein n=1 Tax=Dokdonella ginsengisoli TaxID=363846 RepID=A0ABV9QR70_9GAMM